MTVRELVAEQALALSPEDRVYLLDQLEQSLVPNECVSPLEEFDGETLTTELKRRAEAYQSGTTTACDAFEFMAELRRKRHAESVR